MILVKNDNDNNANDHHQPTLRVSPNLAVQVNQSPIAMSLTAALPLPSHNRHPSMYQ